MINVKARCSLSWSSVRAYHVIQLTMDTQNGYTEGSCFTKLIQKQIHYGAEDKDETCRMSLNDPNCNSDYWWVKVDMSDDNEDNDSGLKEVDFIAEGQNMYGNEIVYR